jgi:DNA invertase Pin-like site-specific DNA recombinase
MLPAKGVIMKKQFDLKEPHRYVMYARMSTDLQNERSPDQQFELIEKKVEQLGHPWTCVGRYRDDGVSGKLTRKRPGFERMRNDIATGTSDADFILVDTMDRFSRSDEAMEIIAELLRKHHVLVLDAANNFYDPTSLMGQLYQNVDVIRARPENEVKSRQVSRGKHDTVRQRFWPGGRPPFGYKLVYIQTNAARGPRSHRAKLVIDPNEAAVVRCAYELALTHGWGENRVYRALREDEFLSLEIRQGLTQSGVGRLLKNEIYTGRLIFGRLNVAIVNDRTVVHRNNEDDLTIVEDYCDPIIDIETFAKVQQLRERRPQTAAGRAKGKEETTRRRRCRGGTALKYPLSGLVVCGVCGNSMNVNSSQSYMDAQGKPRTYPRYTCPRAYQGRCTNRSTIKESWIRGEVATCLRKFLFGETENLDQGPTVCRGPVWMAEFRQEVESAYNKLVEVSIDDTGSLIEERKLLEEQKDGILKSLSDFTISESLRIALQGNFDNHDRRIAEIDRLLQRPKRVANDLNSLFDCEHLNKRLDQLSSLLLDVNPTAANVELSLVIDKIVCNPGNEVTIRFCRLGLLPLNSNVERAFRNTATPKVTGQRTRLACRDVEDDDKAYFAADKNRFDGLPDEWFFEVPLKQPRDLCWSEKHALEVAQYRQEHRASVKEVAAHFGVTEATIIKTLKIARDQHGIDMTGNAVGRRHGKFKAKDLVPHALDYLETHRCSLKEGAAHFGVSPPTFKKATDLGRAARQAEDTAERQKS